MHEELTMVSEYDSLGGYDYKWMILDGDNEWHINYNSIDGELISSKGPQWGGGYWNAIRVPFNWDMSWIQMSQFDDDAMVQST